MSNSDLACFLEIGIIEVLVGFKSLCSAVSHAVTLVLANDWTFVACEAGSDAPGHALRSVLGGLSCHHVFDFELLLGLFIFFGNIFIDVFDVLVFKEFANV